MTARLLIATHNEGKVLELVKLLADLDVELLRLQDVGIDWEVAETGATFEANACHKAQAYATAARLLTLADDSGLEVDALNGQPGVHTSRYGGQGLNSEQRYRLLLEKLQEVPWQQRTARFRCVAALSDGEEILATAEGLVEGRIAMAPSGDGGFGYDPVFYVSEAGETMARLSADKKNRISHRARAIEAIKPALARQLQP